jgi:hypothetical protein
MKDPQTFYTASGSAILIWGGWLTEEFQQGKLVWWAVDLPNKEITEQDVAAKWLITLK